MPAGLDIVDPQHAHPDARRARRCTRCAAGVHVLLEKPPVVSVAEHDAGSRRRRGDAGRVGAGRLPVARQRRRRGGARMLAAPASSATSCTSARSGSGRGPRSTGAAAPGPGGGRRRAASSPTARSPIRSPTPSRPRSRSPAPGRPDDVAGIELDLRRANDIETDDTSSLVIDLASGACDRGRARGDLAASARALRPACGARAGTRCTSTRSTCCRCTRTARRCRAPTNSRGRGCSTTSSRTSGRARRSPCRSRRTGAFTARARGRGRRRPTGADRSVPVTRIERRRRETFRDRARASRTGSSASPGRRAPSATSGAPWA